MPGFSVLGAGVTQANNQKGGRQGLLLRVSLFSCWCFCITLSFTFNCFFLITFGHDSSFKIGQSLSWQISDGARLTQSVWGLWKFADTSDSYYHFDLSLSSSGTSWIDLQLSLVDDYKNKPASPELEKNDLALLANLVLKL